MTEHAPYTLWLMLCGKPYSALVSRLLTTVLPEELYHMTRAELIPVTGEKEADLFLNKDLSAARRILNECAEKGMQVTCYHDPEYPERLREISDPPAALFHYGALPSADRPAIGIVGTRKCSPAAARRTAEFACWLALSGLEIISGMAEGIDAAAHRGPLYRGIGSCAVLGCGADVIYPKKNRDLYEALKQNGTLISEYLPGTQPLASYFPRRNRIISGLSDGVMVMECPLKSGAMITAGYAAEQNRLLFAVPSAPDDPRGTGTNRLIKSGAAVCTEPMDVIHEFLPRFRSCITPLNLRPDQLLPDTTEAEKPAVPLPPKPRATPRPPTKRPSAVRPPSLSPEETAVYNALSDQEPRSLDEISAGCGFPVAKVLSLLQALEFADAVVSLPGATYCRK